MKEAKIFYMIGSTGEKTRVTRREFANAANTTMYAIDRLVTAMIDAGEHVGSVGQVKFEVYTSSQLPAELKLKTMLKDTSIRGPRLKKTQKVAVCDLKQTADGKFIIW